MNDEPNRLLLELGRRREGQLSPIWSRQPPFWQRESSRNAVEFGVAIFIGGMLVVGAEVLQGRGGPATFLNEHGWIPILLSFLGLGLLRFMTSPLRLRRARAVCYTSGIVVELPDLLGLLTGGGRLSGLAWERIAGYRDDAGSVALYAAGGALPRLRVPVHTEEERTRFLALLDERGIPRREG